jgi:hypothetical protein
MVNILKTKTFWACLILALAGLFIGTARALNAPFFHDEHQFIASGQLLARDGLLPYADYPYLHLPYLTFLYGFFFLFSDQHYLIARMISVIGASITLPLILVAAHEKDQPLNLFSALLLLIVTAASGLAIYTEGRSWNHNIPILLAFGAIILYQRYNGSQHPLPLFASGFLAGLATGTRSSFALIVLPFAIDIALQNRRAIKHGIGALLMWAFGFAAALGPVAVLFMLAPYPFIYGNFTYTKLNTIFRDTSGFERAMTLTGKMRFLGDTLSASPIDTAIFVIFIIVLIKILIEGLVLKKSVRADFFLACFALAAFLGALAPTPSWKQYFYAPMIFAIPAIVINFNRSGFGTIKITSVLALTLMIIAIFSAPLKNTAKDIANLCSPSSWVVTEIHNLSQAIAASAPDGKILTLAPSFAMEGDRDTYPQFAVGPFAWRTSILLSDDRRKAYGVIAPSELEAFLQDQPPAAILIGFERSYEGFSDQSLGRLEDPFSAYAEAHGYVPSSTFYWKKHPITIYIQK